MQHRTFVLAHDAGQGGLADRSHLMSGSIKLETHILAVVDLLLWENIKDAVLVGRSFFWLGYRLLH